MTRQRFRLLVSLVSLLPIAAQAAPQAFFSATGGVQQHLVTTIDRTARTLDVAVYDLSAQRLIQAVQRAAERGVTVRVLVDDNVLKEHPNRRELASNDRIVLRSLRGRSRNGGMMHNKFAIFDGQEMVTGSYNWTQGAEYSNYENALFLDDPALVHTFEQNFSDLWDRAGSPAKASHRSNPSSRSSHGKARSHYFRSRSSANRLRLQKSNS